MCKAYPIKAENESFICFVPNTYRGNVYSQGMVFLKTLRLQQFKNYESANIRLNEQVNCFTGRNGTGKTNLLDAIYYLAFTKSYFNPLDAQNIQHQTDYMSVVGEFDRNGLSEKVVLHYQKGKKSVKVNNNELKKFSEHIGTIPLVIITPNDIMLLHEGSEERRKFLDGMISQLDKSYLSELILYNRTIEQRNNYLRLAAEQQIFNPTLLETFNELLVKHGEPLFQKRQAFLETFIPVFNQFYKKIAQSPEDVHINYLSDLHKNRLADLLQKHQSADIAAQRTTKGLHKDELEFLLNNYPIKKIGSQGQQKSFIIALKLAQYIYLKQHTGIKPLLLLDDIFEKLDEHRLNMLLQMIAHDEFGQLFITDTHINRLQEVFRQMPHVSVSYFTTQNGGITNL